MLQGLEKIVENIRFAGSPAEIRGGSLPNTSTEDTATHNCAVRMSSEILLITFKVVRIPDTLTGHTDARLSDGKSVYT